MNTSGILIAGAGLAGLGAALALSRQGQKVTLWEQAAELTEAGAGIQLGPNAVHVLDSDLGIFESPPSWVPSVRVLRWC